jgi:hypothetical protein
MSVQVQVALIIVLNSDAAEISPNLTPHLVPAGRSSAFARQSRAVSP